MEEPHVLVSRVCSIRPFVTKELERLLAAFPKGTLRATQPAGNALPGWWVSAGQQGRESACDLPMVMFW